jgi:aryl-alcohol dehydrogenase-like predicted oxidoreductase
VASDGRWMIDRVPLGRSDLEVPRLGVGAMTWGSPSGRSRWGPAKLAYGGTAGPEDEQLAFEASLSAGANFFDTAAMYSGGASEQRLGELAEGKSVVIATKFPPGWLSKAEALPDALHQSLARLRRSRIDLYQHHFPSRRISIPSLMGSMADAVEAGKVRAIGVSNYSAAQVRIAHAALAERGIPLASNQVEYSLLHRQPEVNGVLDACRELGVTLIAYQPLAQGVLTGKYRPGDRPKGIRRFGRYYRGGGLKRAQPVLSLLGEIGERHAKTPGAGGAAVAHRAGGRAADPRCQDRQAGGQ